MNTKTLPKVEVIFGSDKPNERVIESQIAGLTPVSVPVQLLNENPTTLGHIIVYDGQRACRGEAVARAMRAKKYLVEYRKVPADRIVWRWGGYVSEMMTTLVIHPAGAEIWPFVTTTLSLDDVTFVGNCNRRVRPVKCPSVVRRK